MTVSSLAISGADACDYNLVTGSTSGAVGTITAEPLTITAQTSTKTYDGTTSSVVTPTITSGTLGTGDNADFVETYSSKNVGTGLTLTASGVVSDGTRAATIRMTSSPTAPASSPPRP